MYHIVCHDCTFEMITESKLTAGTETNIHLDMTDHNVEYAEVA